MPHKHVVAVSLLSLNSPHSSINGGGVDTNWRELSYPGYIRLDLMSFCENKYTVEAKK